MYLATKLIIFLPLISALINGIFCKKISKSIASKISTIAINISAICAFFLFVKIGVEKDIIHIFIAKWINIDTLNVSWAIYVDQLTAIMFLLITTVSAVVHIYSLGYMENDKNLPKFLSFLSLFTFFMLALVSSDNFLQLFFGWEGVALCSYLLIGYYYNENAANNAAIKAFVVNRVSNLAFIIGIVMILLFTGSAEFSTVFGMAQDLSQVKLNILGYEERSILDLICFMLLLGCMGKSAQIGMHIWLPDAMESPPPVSALIHAATMVTAGVFLIARCSFIYEYSPFVLQIITIIGAITCLFAALIAIAQSDIKKIIAYSTCSQLGYMFFACGVSAYQVGIFHLFTHGFSKALLFLSAGSVIHATNEQDIFKIGGLRTKMPVTYANFWIGSLAIIGIYPLAGFYSKDLILESAYISEGIGSFAFILGTIATIFTAIYSFKIIILTFHGNTKLSNKAFKKVHESPKIMNLPLLILVAGTLFSGMIGYYILNINNPLGYFSRSLLNLSSTHEHHIPLIIQLLPLIIGICGSILGIYLYKSSMYIKIAQKISIIYYVLQNEFFFDELYDMCIVRPIKSLSKLFGIFDIRFMDRFGLNSLSLIMKGFSWCMCQTQTSYIFNYTFYIILALVICMTIFVLQYLPLLWNA